MDFQKRDLVLRRENEIDRLASLDELFTDFEQWLGKLRKYVINRSPVLDSKTHQTLMQSRHGKENIHKLIEELLFHGVFLQKASLENDSSNIIRNIESSIGIDYVIINILRNGKYTSISHGVDVFYYLDTNMRDKNIREWYVNAPWGKIAVISWGSPDKPPMLLLHGYLDTAATFAYLVEQLPDNYYYVGIDIPGHGQSDAFPPGIHITMVHVIEVIRIVVEDMKWKTFIYLSHSISCIMGLLYEQFYPGSIEKMIFLDPKPALAWYYLINHHNDDWYKKTYALYYDNYEKNNFGRPKSRTYKSWIKSVSRTRKLTEEQSEAVLSRSLIPTGYDQYQLSWEPRSKYIAHVHIPIKTLFLLMTSNLPPKLIVNAKNYADFLNVENSKTFAENLLKDCEKISPHLQVTVAGNHDFHITNPDLIAGHIEMFLKYDKIDSRQISKL